MTTKNFTALKLPYPNYCLEVGYLDLRQNDCNLYKWIPRFSELAQTIEVRKTCSIDPNNICSMANEITGSYVVIRDVRPELFLRRDFIAEFVETGTVHLTQSGSSLLSPSGYQIGTSGNILAITMNEKQYRRFGMIAKKVISNKIAGKVYRVEVDLRDDRIKRSNKYQDKLVQTFRRLKSLDRVYFRYEPNGSMSDRSANEKSLAFFNFVINEYAIDGYKPVPLSKCSLVERKLERRWLNCSQLHPPLRLFDLDEQQDTTDAAGDAVTASQIIGGIQRNEQLLDYLTKIIDWLGYQLLSLDCDRGEIRCRYQEDQERLDVACAQVRGFMDYEQIRSKLGELFSTNGMADGLDIMRALLLYQCPGADKSVVLLQDRSKGIEEASLITVVGMSKEVSE